MSEFKAEFRSEEFEKGVEQMAREVDDAAKRAVNGAIADAGKEFANLAVVLTGDYRRSWVSIGAKEDGKGKWEATGGPDVPYAGKLERQYGTVAKALERANVSDRLADETRKAVT